MHFAQFLLKNDRSKFKRLGRIHPDSKSVYELTRIACNDFKRFLERRIDPHTGFSSEPCHSYEDVIFLPPVTDPEKIICVGLNYQDHCDEQKKPAPTSPIFFSKFNNTLIGAYDDVIAHKVSQKLDWEVELAVIIGKEAKNVPIDNAYEYVFGYTTAQDITARDWQKKNGGQFLIGKSMDTFCPIGPAVIYKDRVEDVNNLCLKTYINGVEKQSGNTRDMIFKIDDMIHRLSLSMTLKPGDIILTGTPKGVGMYRNPPEYLKPGDIIKSRIDSTEFEFPEMVNKVADP